MGCTCLLYTSVNTDPAKVAEKILADIDAKRAALGWAEEMCIRDRV